jgi:hypothetical protein
MTKYNTNPRLFQEPVVTKERGPGSSMEEVVEHPAFATIGASRVQSTGHTLFQSEFKHQSLITIRIKGARVHRGLSNDRVSTASRLPYIEVDLTESQWATFVSSLNVGEGVPCTMTYRNDVGYIPQIPAPPERKQQFTNEMRETLQDSIDHLKKIEKTLESAKITGKLRDELMGHVRMAKQEIQSNMPFVERQFAEHVENTTEAAKQEIHGYMVGQLQRAGMAALANGSDLPLQLDLKDDKTVEG